MAAGDFLVRQGTNIAWRASGGDVALTLTSLANNAGRKGVAFDFGSQFAGNVFPDVVRVELFCTFATAPTAGNAVRVFWASSRDNTVWDGALTNADEAFSDLDVIVQLHFVGALLVNDVTTTQRASWLYRPPARYGFPLVYNAAGQNFNATAADHGLNVTPIITQYQLS
jgi:hypothetical protein